jgi:hypothetical protein
MIIHIKKDEMKNTVHWKIIAAILLAAGMAACRSRTPSSQPQNTSASPVLSQYVWEGTVHVENRYNGEAGEHLWRGEYRVKLLEVPGTEQEGTSGHDYPVSRLYPRELGYALDADQDWNRGPYSASGKNDVRMKGSAAGMLKGNSLTRNGTSRLNGEILRLDAPAPPGGPPDARVLSWEEWNQKFLEIASYYPGRYEISIGDFTTGKWPVPESRALYKGIERSGQEPLFFKDPDQDFLHWVPGWSPDTVLVIGHLDRPDQRDVRGAYTFKYQGPGSPKDREQISIDWNLTRTPVPGSESAASGATGGSGGGPMGGAGADLELTQTATEASARVSIPFVRNFTVKNLGPLLAIRVGLVYEIGSDASYDSSRTDAGSCQSTDKVVYCDLGDLEKGDAVKVEVAVKPQKTDSLKARASVSSQVIPDPRMQNNLVTIDVPIR